MNFNPGQPNLQLPSIQFPAAPGFGYLHPTCHPQQLLQPTTLMQSGFCARREHECQARKQKSNKNRRHWSEYRSKQNLIAKVYNQLCLKYNSLNVLCDYDLRGDSTIRVHVNNRQRLCKIFEALEFVESQPGIKIAKIFMPFSYRKKSSNSCQKKGFLVYMQLENESMVPLAQEAFRKYPEFLKCGVVRESGEYVENPPLASTLF